MPVQELNDHLIKQFGFVPFETTAAWRDPNGLTAFRYRRVTPPLKVVGYVPTTLYTLIILDVRGVEGCPFGYTWEVARVFTDDLGNEIVKDIQRRRAEVETKRKIAILKKGMQTVFVKAQSTGSYTSFTGMCRQLVDDTTALVEHPTDGNTYSIPIEQVELDR